MDVLRYLLGAAFGMLAALSLSTVMAYLYLRITGSVRDNEFADPVGAMVSIGMALVFAGIAFLVWPRRGYWDKWER